MIGRSQYDIQRVDVFQWFLTAHENIVKNIVMLLYRFLYPEESANLAKKPGGNSFYHPNACFRGAHQEESVNLAKKPGAGGRAWKKYFAPRGERQPR